MKRLSLLLAIIASLVMASTAIAASPPGKNPIRCEAGGDASSTQNGAQGCEFVVGEGGAAFAYYGTAGDGKFYPNAWDKNLSSIRQLSFRYSGDEPYGGAPRFSLQIDPDGPGAMPVSETYVFVLAETCNDGSGLVDVIGDETCVIYYGSEEYDNWAAFAAAYPDATLYFAFVVADQPGTWSISSVKIGKPGNAK